VKKGWEQTTIGAAAEFVSTGPFGSLLHKKDYVLGDGIAVLNPIDMIDGSVNIKQAKKISTETAGRLQSYCLSDGDVLIARRGDIGRCAVIGPQHANSICGTGCFFIRPTKRVDPIYLARLIASPAIREALISKSSGTTMQNLSNTTLKTQEIFLPPFEEQKQIVAILDEAFEGLDRARANVEANLEDAESLFHSVIDHLFRDSSKWSSPQICEIGEVFDGPHATPKTVDSGPLFLGVSSLVNGRIELAKTRHVTEEDFAKWTRRVAPSAGDVVFSYETRLGQVGIIPDGMRCCLGRRMGLVRLDPSKVLPEYFAACFISSSFQEFLRNKTVKGATVDRISIKEFPSFEFPLPPLDKQRVIVGAVKEIRAEHDSLTEVIETKVTDLADLRQSLLQKAFAGELT
jgi:type I restriction enzyme S subunit